jgi:hypothetical protein
MGLLNNIPGWNAPEEKVVEPKQVKKDSGWNPGERPPAYVFNWMWNMVSNALETLSNHLHDDRYSKKDHTHSVTEVSGKIDNAAYADNADKLDGRDASDFASSSHSHPYSPENHTHDGRYYKESEVNNLINNLQNEVNNLKNQSMDLENVYPVGSLYFNAVSGQNPETLLGFGKWQRFSKGRVLVGLDESDGNFNGLQERGGAKTHRLTDAEMPKHKHISPYGDTWNTPWGTYGNWKTGSGDSDSDNHYHWTSPAGGDKPHNNLQPYITVYIWRRTQ